MKLFRILPSLIIIIMITGCGSSEKKQDTKKYISVRAVPVEEARLVESIKTTGDVIATNTVIIRATVEGQISYSPWREGDYIKAKGEKLIVIDRPIYKDDVYVAKADLEVAQAKLADLKYGPRKEEIAKARELVKHYENCTHFAKIDFERIAGLASSHALSKKEHDEANVNYIQCKSQLEIAKNELALLEEGTKKTEISIAEANVKLTQAKLNLAQSTLNECTIKAPFAGIITQVYVRPGDVTSLRSGPRPPLIKIMDASSLVIKAGLPENCAASIKKGTKVAVRLDAYPRKEFNAAIVRIYPRIEPNSRTRIIEVKINDKVKLLPNMFARITVAGRVFDNALVVPDTAIITTHRGAHIVFIIKNGKAVAQNIKIGLEENRIVQVLNGVKKGEFVVTDGNLNLKDGARVKIINRSSSSDKLKQQGSNRQ